MIDKSLLIEKTLGVVLKKTPKGDFVDDNNLIKRLNRNPHIRARLEALLSVAENTSGEFKTADAAENALADGVRQMGKELLQDWATSQNTAAEAEAAIDQALRRHSKKNFIGEQLLEKSK